VSSDLSDRRRRGRKFRWKISEGFDPWAALALSYLVHNPSRHGTARAGKLVRAALCNGAIGLSLANRAAHEKKSKRRKPNG
jgi:hypothetical protein